MPPTLPVPLIEQGYPVSASSAANDYTTYADASNVIDGDTSTLYRSAYGNGPIWLEVDIKNGQGSEVTIETVSIWNDMFFTLQENCCERNLHGTRISLLGSDGSVLASAVVGVVQSTNSSLDQLVTLLQSGLILIHNIWKATSHC